MTQMFPIHQALYSHAYNFLSQDLATLRTSKATLWGAFTASSGLSESEATASVLMGTSQPLIFPSKLGEVVYSQFDPQVPGRIEIGTEVLARFEQTPTDQSAQDFLRAKVLHEMCHWGRFRKQLVDNDEAGEQFEKAAFGRELIAWWVPPGAVAGSLNEFTDATIRAQCLRDLLGRNGFLGGRTSDPSHRVFGGVDAAAGMPRGFRNSNPGNIRKSSASPWRGLADPDDLLDFQRTEASFCVFREPEWGLRAMAIILRRYQSDHGLNTPIGLIGRWAPAADNNDVASYAKQVADALNVAPTAFVDTKDTSTMQKLMQAISRHENGDRAPYTDVQYQAALELAKA